MNFPFEIHVTVNALPSKIDEFNIACKDLNVKPIVIDTNTDAFDVMTSSTIITTNNGVFDEIDRIKKGLNDYGFNVIREKIETVPWHPSAPNFRNSMPRDCYFECHFNILTNIARLNTLRQISKQLNCHLSKNVFKKINELEFFQMMTFRSYVASATEFQYNVNNITSILQKNEFQLEKFNIEFAIYDSNVSHDHKWLTI